MSYPSSSPRGRPGCGRPGAPRVKSEPPRRSRFEDRAQRLELCHDRLVEDWRSERRANRDYEAYRARGVMRDGRRFGRRPNPHTPPAQPAGKINLTDPDSKNMKYFRGASRLQRPDGTPPPAHRRRRDRPRRA